MITAADRIGLLEDEAVDLVIRNFTINCSRWEQIAFSQVYYAATQKVLVSRSLAESGYDGVEDLEDLRVCAPFGSTSLDNIVEPPSVRTSNRRPSNRPPTTPGV